MPRRRPGVHRRHAAPPPGLSEEAIAGQPPWIDTGVAQLGIPLASAEVVSPRPSTPDITFNAPGASVALEG